LPFLYQAAHSQPGHDTMKNQTMREKRRVRLSLSEEAFRFAREIEATAKETGQHPDDILRALSQQAQDRGDRRRVSLILLKSFVFSFPFLLT
jgi:hypothetical protein